MSWNLLIGYALRALENIEREQDSGGSSAWKIGLQGRGTGQPDPLGPWKGGPCLSLIQNHQRPWERGAGTTGVPRGLLKVGVAKREPSCSSGLTNFGTVMKSQWCACLLGPPPASGKLARRVGEAGGVRSQHASEVMPSPDDG